MTWLKELLRKLFLPKLREFHDAKPPDFLENYYNNLFDRKEEDDAG